MLGLLRRDDDLPPVHVLPNLSHGEVVDQMAVISKGEGFVWTRHQTAELLIHRDREIRYTRRSSRRRRSATGPSKEKEMKNWLAGAPPPPPPPTPFKIREDIKRQARRDATRATNAVKGRLQEALRDVPPPKPPADENRR